MNNSLYKKYIYRSSIGLIILFITFPVLTVCAQNLPFSNKQFIQKDGLSQVTINDMIEDDLGFVWIATDHGLNRFDGSTFKTFIYNDEDSTSLSGNLINTLYKDKKGNIWNGSSDGGLCYFDLQQNVFKKVQLLDFKDISVSTIVGGKMDDIWVGTNKEGLFRLSKGKNDVLVQNHFFSTTNISKLYYDGTYLWIGDFEGHVYQCQHKNNNFKILNQVKVEGQVRSFIKTNRHLLIGTNDGLFQYNSQQDEPVKIVLEDDGEPIKYISELLMKDHESIWIASADGLHLYDLTLSKIVQSYNNSPTNGKTLSNNTILSILELTDKTFLVGSANGLNMLSFTPPVFNNISKDLSLNNLLNDNVVFSILKDKEGLWIGTSEGGLNYILGDKVYYYNNSKDNKANINGTVRSIIKDKINNRIWLATTRGLNMIDLTSFDPNNPKIISFKNIPTDTSSLPFNYLKDLAIDQNNNIWGATFGLGIFRMEYSGTNNVKFIKYLHQEDKNSISSNFNTCIRVDNNNNIWVGSGSGLSKIEFKDNNYNKHVFINYKNIPNDQNTLTNNTVNDILIGTNNKIWIATHKGISQYDGQKIKSWPSQNQYSHPITYLVEEDNNSNIWLGTNEGLIHLDVKKDKFSKYTTEDGIKHNEFDTHARYKDKKGNIYLGGLGGVTYFHPNDLKNIDKVSPLYFSELRIKNNIHTPKIINQSILSDSGINYKKLVFDHDEFPFYIKFSTLDFSQYKNTTFAYRILPLSNEWNTLKDTEIQFLNSPKGDFTLQVNGFSRGTKWESNPLEIKFEVLPPYWATWWAYIWYISFIGIMIYQIYNFKISRKLALAESVRLKEIGLLKNQLYTNITHEFRTPLTVIKGMTQVLETDLKDKNNSNTKSSIQMIQGSANKLLLLVNEMLDLAKIESGNMSLNQQQSDIIPYLKYLSESFILLAKEKGSKIMVYSEIDTLLMDFDPEKLTTVISNLLTNAINISNGAERIVVHINKINNNDIDYLSIKIQDNGEGFYPDEIQNIFIGYNKRNKENTGTRIGLTLSKEIVNLMNGNIRVKSELGTGSTFTLQLPITNIAPKAKNIAINTDKYIIDTNVSIKKEQNSELSEIDKPLILVIEDNEDVAFYLESCLKNDYKVVHAIDGVIGIEKALENVPDIIISDVMMPNKDGFEVCKELKKNEITDHIPIILLTAKATIQDKIEGLSSGADAYLAKPFVKEELLTRIEKLISSRKRMIEKFKYSHLNKTEFKSNNSVESKFINKVIKIITSNLNDDKFGPIQLAVLLSLSDSQLYRKLKGLTDKSTAVFIRSIRLQRAKELLSTTNKAISEIAYEVGFSDPSWFSRVFKDVFGSAPSQFRK